MYKLKEIVEKGHSDIYLKEVSNIYDDNEYEDKIEIENTWSVKSSAPERIIFKRLTFKSRGYSGLYFTSGDIDYLNAKVYIEPIKTQRNIKNIFLDIYWR